MMIDDHGRRGNEAGVKDGTGGMDLTFYDTFLMIRHGRKCVFFFRVSGVVYGRMIEMMGFVLLRLWDVNCRVYFSFLEYLYTTIAVITCYNILAEF